MREIICDTNIWYGLGNQSILKPQGFKLIATWINIIEIGFSHPEIKARLVPDECISASKAILDYAERLIIFDPFAYATNKIVPDFILHPIPLESILIDISQSGLPNAKAYHDHKACYDYFMTMKNHFAQAINSEKSKIRKSELQNNLSKEEFKNSDSSQIVEHSNGLLSDIKRYLKMEHNKQIDFSKLKGINGTHEYIKEIFECYIITKQIFMKKFILDKCMKCQSNDFYDLLNLLYVDNDKLFWTKEARWKAAFKEAKMSKYLYEQ